MPRSKVHEALDKRAQHVPPGGWERPAERATEEAAEWGAWG